MRYLASCVVLFAVPAATAQRPVVDIKVTGNERFAAATVIAASGLRVGQTAGRKELDAAVQQLLDTGIFLNVNYRYDLKTAGGTNGFAVTLQVCEEPARLPVELDLPGQDAEVLWPQLKAAGFIDRQMPENERALAYYRRTIEAFLRKSNHPQEIELKTESDIYKGKTVVLCRPAHLPRLTEIRFDGNAAIPSGVLGAHLTKVAMGQECTERDLRRMVELNLRPLYEELGRLTVVFSRVRLSITGDTSGVTVEINEGPVWRLGNVELTGENVPVAAMHEAAQFAEGAAASWPEFLASVSKMEQVLRRDGYIGVSSTPVRAFRNTDHIVDVSVKVDKGRQFLFGELLINGLDPETRQRLGGQWKLAGGAPMNEPYIRDFMNAVLPSLRGKIKSSQTGMHVRPGKNIVDVVITFR